MKQETCGDFGLVAERQWRNVEAADRGSGTPRVELVEQREQEHQRAERLAARLRALGVEPEEA